MKKVNFKKVLIALVAVFSLMFVGVDNAGAQTATTSGFTNNSGAINFLGTSEAQDVLMNTINDLKNDALNLTPGSPAYQAIKKTGLYYVGVHNELVNGKDVPSAINQGIYNLNDTNGFGGLPSSEHMTLMQGAVDLLKL